MMTIRYYWLFGLAVMMLAGCANSGGYNPLRDTAFKGPTLQTVRTELGPDSYKGSRVRWGGEIARVENQRTETWLEVVEKPLQRSGRPRDVNTSEGRFIARISGFLDPAIYAAGRQITVIGKLTDKIQRTIGEYPYQFPVVAVDNYQLWEVRRDPEVIYYHDPFWGPWYWPRPYSYRYYRRY
ncbi:MAG: Slp family lipoprotein [Candidatus Competibacteraceae bacterium]|jgi:outer membrane lipoprotein|nr:Slp family lipoprotein [Candidatus Competibacteraceae bacterium]